eukprot:gene5836-9659_t
MFTFFINDINEIFNKNIRINLDIQKEINLTLEEFYFGCKKEVSFVRKLKIKSREFQSLEKIIIEIPKGTDNNSIFTFENFGNEKNGMKGNLNLKIKEIPNEFFERNGNDLIYFKKITLSESLLGLKFKLKFFDKDLLIDLRNEIISPNFERIINNEGMNRNGNLIIKFDIEFPKLNENKLNLLEDILNNSINYDIKQNTKVIIPPNWSTVLKNIIIKPLNNIITTSRSYFSDFFIRNTSALEESSCICKNGGKKKFDSERKCFCKCKNNWKGKLCEECKQSEIKCKNGGEFNPKKCSCDCKQIQENMNFCKNDGIFSKMDCSCKCKKNSFWQGEKCEKCSILKCNNNGKLNKKKCKCDCIGPSFGEKCEKKSVILITNSITSSLLNNHIIDISNFYLKEGHKVTIGFITNPMCLKEPCPFQLFKKLMNRKVYFKHIDELIGGKVISNFDELSTSYWAFDFLRRNEKDFNLVHFFDFTGFYSIKLKNQFGLYFKNLNLVFHSEKVTSSMKVQKLDNSQTYENKIESEIHENTLKNKLKNEIENFIFKNSDLNLNFRPFKIRYQKQFKNIKQIILYGNSFYDFYLFKKLSKNEFKNYNLKFLFFLNEKKERNLIKLKNDDKISISFVNSFLKLKTWILSKEKSLIFLTKDDSIIQILMENNFPFLVPENSNSKNLYSKQFLYNLKNLNSIIKQFFHDKIQIKKNLKKRLKWEKNFKLKINSLNNKKKKKMKIQERVAIIVRSSQNFENLHYFMNSILEQTYKLFDIVIIAENNTPQLFHHLRKIKKQFIPFNIKVMITFSPIGHHGIGVFFDQGFEYFKKTHNYFLFVDSEYIIMKPILLESFIKSIQFQKFDILTSFYDIMPKDRKYPWPWEDEFYKRKLFFGSIESDTGGGGGVGALENIYGGEGLIFLNKKSIEKVGKFINLKNCQVWDFVVRSILKNLKYDCIPLSLFWTRHVRKDFRVSLKEIIKEKKRYCSQVVSKYFTNEKEEKISGILQFGIGKYIE